MIVHNFDPVFIDLGVFQIRWYSIAYIVGIILGWIYAIKIIKEMARKHNFTMIKKTVFDDLIIYLIIGIVLGGRLGYVIFYNFEYYSRNLFEILKLWEGGMSFHGGLLGVIIATIIFSKIKRINFFYFTDIICCVAPIGLFLGRIANFINGELWGKVTDVPWAMVFPGAGPLPRHPSQLYEAALEGVLLFIILWWFSSKPRPKAAVSGLFLLGYGFFRFLVEFVRIPDAQYGYLAFDWLTMGQILCLPMIVFGIILMIVSYKVEARVKP